MIRPKKPEIDQPTKDYFSDWEWGDADLAPLLKHFRQDTAKIITDEIADSCVGWISEGTGIFYVDLFGFGAGFSLGFDIVSALAEGEIEFDDIDELKQFHSSIQAVADNLHRAIAIADSRVS